MDKLDIDPVSSATSTGTHREVGDHGGARHRRISETPALDASQETGETVDVTAAPVPRRFLFLGRSLVRKAPRTAYTMLIATVLLLLLGGSLATRFFSLSLTAYQIGLRAEEIRQDVIKREQRVAALKTRIAYLETDAYVEAASREKLSLVRPGDHAVIMLPERDEVAWVPEAPPVRPSGPFGQAFGQLDAWFRLFFGAPDEGILGRRP